MANAKTLYAKIVASAEGFDKVMSGVANKTDQVARSVNKSSSTMTKGFQGLASNAGTKFTDISKSMGSISQRSGEIGSKMTNSITKPAGVATGALAGMVGALGFKRLIGMDDAQAKIQGLGYSGKEVTSIQGDVTKAIEGSMTTMAEGTDAAAGALGSGVKRGKELQEYIKGVGNAAQGAGVPVGEMAQIFSRVRGTNKLATEELQMMEERLPGFSSTLAKSLGVSYEEMRTMVTNGEVDFDEFMVAVDKRAGASSKAVAQSFRGMATNSLNYIGMIGQAFLEPAFKEAKVVLADVVKALNSEELRRQAGIIGSQVAPIFTFLTKAVFGTIKAFFSLPAPLLKVISVLGLLAIGAGPVVLAFSKITGVIATLFGPLGTLFTTLGTVIGAISKTGSVVAGLSAVFPKLAGAFTLLGGPVGWIVAGIIALGTAFVIAYQKSETFRNFINGIGALFGRAIGWIKQFASAIGSLFAGNTQEGTSLLKRLGFNPEQVSLIQGIVTQLKGIFSIFGQSLKAIFGGIKSAWNGVISLFSGSGSFIAQAFSNIITMLTPIFQAIGNIVRNSVTQILTIVKSVFQVMRGVMQVFGGLFKGDWRMVWAGIKNIFWGALNGIIALVKLMFMNMVYAVIGIVKMWVASLRVALGVLKNVFVAIWNGIKFVTLYIWNGIKNAVITSVQTLKLRATQILNGLKIALTAIWNGIKFISIAVWNGIKWAVVNAIRILKNTGLAILRGLRAGIVAIWNGIKTASIWTWNLIKNSIMVAVRAIRTVALAILRGLRAGIIAIWNGIKSVSIAVWNGIKNAILNAIRITRSIALSVLRALRSGVIAIWNGIKSATSSAWNWIKNKVIALVRGLRATVLAVFRALRAGIIAVWNAIKSATSSAWNWIKNKAVALARTLRAVVLAVFRSLRAGVIAIWNAIKSATSSAWNWIKNKAVALARALRNTVTSIFRALKNAIVGIWNSIKSATSSAWNWIKNKASSLASSLRNAVTSTFNKLKNTVSNIWNSIKSNTSNVWKKIKSSIIDFANGIKSGVTGAFDKMKGALSKSIEAIKGFVQDMIDKVKGGLNKLIDGVNWVGEKLGMGKIGHVKMHTGTSSSNSSVVSRGRINTDTFATVGDRGRGNGPGGFRHETVVPPKGRPFITPNRDTLMPVTKGTSIMNGKQTHSMLSDMSHKFASGTKKGGGGSWWDQAKDATAGFGKGAAKKVHGASKATAEKFKQGKDATGKFLNSAKENVGKGAKWLGDKVGDVMDYVKSPGKLLNHVLKAFGVNFDALGKNNIPADMMAGMFTKLKESAKNLIKQWLEEAQEGSGDASWLFKHPIWQKFGNYTGGLNFNGGKHYGMDFGMPTGTSVKAVAGGKVTKTWNDYGGGKSVEVQVGKGLWNWYMHLSKILAKRGQKIEAGDEIGKSGATGNFVRGAHLHFQLNKGDHSGNDTAVDPMKWLKGLSGKGTNKSAKKWAPDIKRAAKEMKVNLSSKELNGIIAQIQRESNGNAGVTQGNIGDINNLRGTPAQGLLQYVPSTFKSYAVKGKNQIKNGYHQLLAFFNNSNWRKDLPYGKSGWGPSGARRFAEGGIITAPELAWVGEGGFSESIISHDPRNRTRSKAIHDKTGKMLGVDDETDLLREIASLLEFNNDLNVEGNRNTRAIANKNTSINIDGKEMTREVDRNMGDMYRNEIYNNGGQR